MVGPLTIAALMAAAILSVGIPVLLVVVTKKRWGFPAKTVVIGALIFVVFQMVLRLPFLTALSRNPIYQTWAARPWFLPLFLGFSAALFEEGGRLAGFRVFLGRKPDWRDGLGVGLGHAGAESLLIGGVTYVNNLIASSRINAGIYPAPGADPARLEALSRLKETLVSTEWYWFLLGGGERVFSIAIQVGLTFLVLQALRESRGWPLVIACVLHLLVNAGALYLKASTGFWAAEVWVLIWAVWALFYYRRYIRPRLVSGRADIDLPPPPEEGAS